MWEDTPRKAKPLVTRCFPLLTLITLFRLTFLCGWWEPRIMRDKERSGRRGKSASDVRRTRPLLKLVRVPVHWKWTHDYLS